VCWRDINNNKNDTKIRKKMNVKNSNICLEAFNQLCDELSISKLVSAEECQYWKFERGYQAALNELISNMSIVAASQSALSLDKVYLARKAA
jgi:hypothetical protein